MGFTHGDVSDPSMLGIVVSRADAASIHIGEQLRDLAEWTPREDPVQPDDAGGGTYYRTTGAELREFEGLHIELDRPADVFGDPDLLVIASRHSGDTGPLLTAHCTGNFGPAEFGGSPDQLAMAAPGALAETLASFDQYAPERYDTGLECTHHGPTDVDVPSLFVEIGSDEAQWRDSAAATAVGRTILSLRGVEPLVERSFVGFGGGHYVPRFTRIVRETDWAVGHMAADWGLEAMDGPEPAVIEQAFERSGARFAVVDGEHPDLVEAIEAAGYRDVGESWIRETVGVALPVVEAAEAELCPIDRGLRFGRAARSDVEQPELYTVEPAPGLLADANAIDVDRVRGAIAEEAVAYETGESGRHVEGRIAVPRPDAWERIESALVALLRERFDQVVVDADEIVVVEQAFDPERARELGVDPGPAFGRLADGEPVTVGDEVVEPAAVHVTRTRRYPR